MRAAPGAASRASTRAPAAWCSASRTANTSPSRGTALASCFTATRACTRSSRAESRVDAHLLAGGSPAVAVRGLRGVDQLRDVPDGRVDVADTVDPHARCRGLALLRSQLAPRERSGPLLVRPHRLAVRPAEVWDHLLGD